MQNSFDEYRLIDKVRAAIDAAGLVPKDTIAKSLLGTRYEGLAQELMLHLAGHDDGQEYRLLEISGELYIERLLR